MQDRELYEAVVKIYDSQQSLITSADNKASISLAIQLFVSTTIFGAAVIVDPLEICDGHLALLISRNLLFLLFLVSSTIGLIASIYVIKPRTGKAKNKGMVYFGHISARQNSDEYHKELLRAELKNLAGDYAKQNFTLAKILERKMKYLKISGMLLILSIASGLSLFVISVLAR